MITLGALSTGKLLKKAPFLARRTVTLLSKKFAIQMFSPSKAAPQGPVPTGKVPWISPLRASTAVMVLFERMAIHILLPSKAKPRCSTPPGSTVPISLPSLERSLPTSVLSLPTQILAPSEGGEDVNKYSSVGLHNRVSYRDCHRMSIRSLAWPRKHLGPQTVRAGVTGMSENHRPIRFLLP